MKHRRKKHSKISGKRITHRRKSGLHGIDFTNILGVVAGAIGGGYLDKLIPDSIDKKIVAGGKIALGVALPMFVKSGSMKNILGGVGSGLVAVGSINLLTELGVLSGTDDELLEISLNGDLDVLAGDLDVINGDTGVIADDDLSVINGDEEEDEMY